MTETELRTWRHNLLMIWRPLWVRVVTGLLLWVAAIAIVVVRFTVGPPPGLTNPLFSVAYWGAVMGCIYLGARALVSARASSGAS